MVRPGSRAHVRAHPRYPARRRDPSEFAALPFPNAPPAMASARGLSRRRAGYTRTVCALWCSISVWSAEPDALDVLEAQLGSARPRRRSLSPRPGMLAKNASFILRRLVSVSAVDVRTGVRPTPRPTPGEAVATALVVVGDMVAGGLGAKDSCRRASSRASGRGALVGGGSGGSRPDVSD